MSNRPPSKKAPSQTRSDKQRRRWWAGVTRDLILFVTGLLLFIYEAAIRKGDPRESILFMEAGMMGLSTILRAEEFRRRSDRNGDGSDGSSD